MSVKSGKLLSGEDLLQSHTNSDRSLPKVGVKAFKPSGSWLEKKQIQAALEENKQMLEEERVEKLGALNQADWYAKKKLAEVTKKVGKFHHTMGFERSGKFFLYPEEALFLMETNCLQLNYDGVPMSIQQAYSVLLSPTECSLKEYRAYSHLTKQGYRLLRHNKTGLPTNYELQIRLDQHAPHKRVFPEVNVGDEQQTPEITEHEEEVAGITEGDQEASEPAEEEEQTSGVTVGEGAATEESPRKKTVDMECGEEERKEGITVKTENAGADVNGPMKDFAKSVADMGKSLVKSEKCDGSEGLGLAGLRQKILDMLESHFQGQISQEAMDAVSLSASNAILIHVEGGNSEKSCASSIENSDKRQDNADLCLEKTSNHSSDRSRDSLPQEKSASSEGISSKESVHLSKEKFEESGEVDAVQGSTKTDLESEEPSEKTGDAVLEDVSMKSIDVEYEVTETAEASTKSGVAGTEEANGEAELEKSPKKGGDAELENTSENSGNADSEKNGETKPAEVSAKNGEAVLKELSERYGEAGVSEVCEKSGEAGVAELSEKSSGAGAAKVSEKSGEAIAEEVSEKSGEAESEKVTKNINETEGRSKEAGEVESEEFSKKGGPVQTEESAGKSVSAESEDLAEKSGNLVTKTVNLKSDTESKQSSDLNKNEVSEKSENLAVGEESKKKSGLEKELNRTDLKTTVVEERTVNLDCSNDVELDVCDRTGELVAGNSEEPSNSERSSLVTQEEKTDKNTRARVDLYNKECEAEKINGNKENDENGDGEMNSTMDNSQVSVQEDSEELLEIPIEGYSSQTSSHKDADVSSLFESPSKGNVSDNESDAEILEFRVFDGKEGSQEEMQVDDDVVEIEDPNSWRNVKVEASDKPSKKRSFSDSNGWRSFKESQDNPDKKAKHADDHEVDIIAVRSTKDIELIDITEDGCVTVTTTPKHKEDIEVVDLDESESDSDSDISEEKPVVKEEKVSQRPKIPSAAERARDSRRNLIMDSFPNMIQRPVLTVQVPLQHLLPPNVDPVQQTYTIQRRALYAERYRQPRPQFHQRRHFNPNTRYNNYNNRHTPRPLHHHPRFKPPINHQGWQGMPLMQNAGNINPAAMQAFQMITSIVLPMFGINNVGPTFRGQQPWNQNPNMAPAMWQQRTWQNNQPWRYQPRNNWNNNRFNRPWQNRNSDRDEVSVPERPKRPALLQNPGQTSPTPGSWNNDRLIQPVRSESRRPKRPFLFESSNTQRTSKTAEELLTDIEDELCWKRVKTLNDGSDSDSGEEVTITPIRTPKKASELQPLLRLDQCTNSASIMESLQVIEKADPRTLTTSGPNRCLKISFDMFQPNIPFKKSSPPRPSYRLCVMSVDEQFPSPGEISFLLDDIHDNVPLLFAIVHPDDISFFNYSSVDIPKQTFSS